MNKYSLNSTGILTLMTINQNRSMSHQTLTKRPRTGPWFGSADINPNEAIGSVWEKTDPIATVTKAISGPNKSGELKVEDEELIFTKRVMLSINVCAILVCTGLLFNRASVCIGR